MKTVKNLESGEIKRVTENAAKILVGQSAFYNEKHGDWQYCPKAEYRAKSLFTITNNDARKLLGLKPLCKIEAEDIRIEALMNKTHKTGVLS